MTFTTFSFNESCQAAPSDLHLPARRLLRLLLESVEKHDAATTHETVHDAVDVGLALLSQLPQLAVELLDQGFAGGNVPNLELLDRPVETRLRRQIELSRNILTGLWPLSSL
jgi:hypothetical protein